MLTKITLVVALCSHLTTGQIQSKMKELESQNPNNKVTLRIDQKAECTSDGQVIQKTKGKRGQKNLAKN